ncbi:MAG: PQQ-binding-like beta-propeller repeat protein [Verrucomicrobiia bacterium]
MPVGIRARLLFGIVAVVAAGLDLIAKDSPQWGERYTRNMVSTETNLPAVFDPASRKNIKWIAELGSQTHSTPVVASGRVFIGTNNDRPRDPKKTGDRGVLMCFDEKSGEFLWQLVVPKYSDDIYQDWPKAGICSPATVEGDRVYILSNRGEAMCLDIYGMKNGNDGPFIDESKLLAPAGTEKIDIGELDADIIWTFNIHGTVKTYPHDSAHSSFLIHRDFIYINTGNGVDNTHRRIRAPDAPSLIVLEKQSGRLVAMDEERIGPRIFHSTWSSPSLAVVNGKELIIFCGGDGVVYAFEALREIPKEGDVLKLKRVWKFDCDPEGPKEDVHRFIGNRKESPMNIKSMPVVYKNRVYVTAGGDEWWGKNKAFLFCIDATKSGDITFSGRLWSAPLSNHCMSTPAIYDGLVFVGDSGRHINCIDAESGEIIWTQETKGAIWASPLVADGKVYIGTRSGDFWVMSASREKRVLYTIDLGAPISSSAIAANRTVYIATMTKLYAVGYSE